jgi:gamma-glutamyltranspeptidase/glutathione hydrolase
MKHTPFYPSYRSPLVSRKGIVAASQPLAVAAGLNILAQGGNAADAAIATAAALNVTEPSSTGIGGDCFALYYDAVEKRVSALNGSGRAPKTLSLERLRNEGFSQLPAYHPYTITVPGACAGWCDFLERFGKLSLAEVLMPAIRLAEEGFPVAPLTAYFWERAAQGQLSQSLNGCEMTINGRGPRAGEIFRNPGLARTLRAVAEGGKAAFYQGEIAEAIARTIQAAGGCMQVDDLAAHTSTWETPLQTTYRHLRIWECPPNGQGLTALIALNILEGFDLANLEPLGVERLHLEIEALRLAFADTRWFVADPATNPAPLAGLLSKDYAAERRHLIHPHRASVDRQHGSPTASSDTVYFSVVDNQGNACSLINSNYMGFGTGIVPSGWGFTLQNRGHNFSLEAGHPNALAPGKRPYHTIIPAMATRLDPTSNPRDPREDLFASFGVMGGFMQPQGHMQVVIALADDGLDPQAALDRPRFCIEDGRASGRVALEEGISPQVMTTLEAMGHSIRPVSGFDRALFGRGQVIVWDKDQGVFWAGSDPRSDGCAMTLT